MTQYNEYKPNQLLSKYVDCYWTLDITGNDIDTNYEERVIPLGFPEIITHYGAPFLHIKKGKRYNLPRSILTGQLTKSNAFRPTGLTGILGVKFKPYGAYFFIQKSSHVYTDKCSNLESIFSKNAINKLISDISGTSYLSEKISFMESFLVKHLRNRKVNIPIEQIVKEIISQPGSINVKDLSSKFYCSQSKLERSFKNIIGLTPKKYSQIVRFNKILKEYKKNKNLQSLAYKYGYYDYPHFIRNFSAFSGFTPNEFDNIKKSITEKLAIQENADFLQQSN